jgi:hypothetical protein
MFHLPELRGPVELPSGERQCARTPLGVSWWTVQDNPNCSSPEPGERFIERASWRIFERTSGIQQTPKQA